MTLRESEIQRYSRQIILREIGGGGQEKLAAATVLVAGVGALGSPIACYLACAGVGHLLIVDSDQVEISNLQRQFLHTTDRIGWPKVASAARALHDLNPEIRISPLHQRITADTVDDLVRGCDVIADGTDNFPTRYLLNQAAHRGAKPLVTGAVLGFDGQISVFRHGLDKQAPCYQCLFPQPPDPASAPTCATAGVLGAVPGMIGSLQAVEVIKTILGIGDGLAGSLLMVNALHGVFHKIAIPKNGQCPTCGEPREGPTMFQ